MILVGSVASETIVICLDPAEDQLSNSIPFHGDAVKPINQFLFERCKKAFHPRVIKTAVCASHALPNGSIPSEQRAVFLAGVLAAVIRMKDQTRLIAIAGKCMAKRIAALARAHMWGALHNRLPRYQSSPELQQDIAYCLHI